MQTIELNRDYVTRDTLLFGGYDSDAYSGGIRRFHCSYGVLADLIEEGFVDINERQNCSPSIGEMMEMLNDDCFDVEFRGYAVSPKRPDYRISIEQIIVRIPDDCFDAVISIVENVRDADEFSMEHHDDTYYIDAWWD